ncbi:MAG: GNAT family N-acetyltransferase [Proteobacteria bacterium]|nr:GNAT family N-acetyltransferase [Pseudomonadota bacterium]
MNNSRDFSLRLARWPKDINPLREVRTEVFIEEQNVPPEEEWDGLDDQCLHVLAVDTDENPIGTGRLLSDGKIGRMAVVKEWRGKGVGAAILELLMNEARERGHASVKLAAQVHAMPFYERFGFRAYGDEFMDAGIPHYWMKVDPASATRVESGE